MKKLFLVFALSLGAMHLHADDSLSLFDKNTYKVANLKKLAGLAARLGFQSSKVWTGKWLFCSTFGTWKQTGKGVGPGGIDTWSYRRNDQSTIKKYTAKFGGAVLVLHGLKGILHEFGFETPATLYRYLEGKD